MNKDVSETDYLDPFLAQFSIDDSLFFQKYCYIAVPINFAISKRGNDMIANIERCFDGQLQETLRAPIMFRVVKKFLQRVLLKAS